MNLRRLISLPQVQEQRMVPTIAKPLKEGLAELQRPLWVKSRHVQCKGRCPLHPRKRPRKRTSANSHVGFTPESGHVQRSRPCLLWANSGPMQRSKKERYSITSSARARSVGGIVRPRAFAVVRLRTRSNLVGCSTGMSPGFAPRRILSTISAVRLHWSRKFGP